MGYPCLLRTLRSSCLRKIHHSGPLRALNQVGQSCRQKAGLMALQLSSVLILFLPVPTPSPNDPGSQMSVPESSPQPVMTDISNTSPFQSSPRSFMPPPLSNDYLQVPQHRVSHVNYVPQAGNAPLVNDYAGMPCNLQERMSIGQQNGHTFHMPMSLEETLANLPYDAITLQRAISNHSGKPHHLSLLIA